MFLSPDDTRKINVLPIVNSKNISQDVINIHIPKLLLTILGTLLGSIHIAFAVIIFYFGNLNLQVELYHTRVNVLDTHINISLIQMGEFHITYLVGILFATTAFFHLLNITILRSHYFTQLSKCRSPIRWLEYCITSGLSMSITSVICGVREIMLLVSLSLLISAAAPYGYWSETLARPKSLNKWHLSLKKRLVAFVLCIGVHIAVWSVLVFNIYAQGYLSIMPGYVHAILWTQLVMFPSFVLILSVQHFTRPKRYIITEITYQLSSLITKTTLGVLLFVYVLREPLFREQFKVNTL
jgi:hypothetical protein